MRKFAIAAFAALGLAAVPAFAADTGPYIGAGVGQFSTQLDSVYIDDEGALEFGFDESDVGFKVFGGYNFLEWLGAEVGYIDGGTAEEEYSDPDIGSAKLEADVSAFTIAGVGTLPIGDMFELYGKLGMAFWDGDLTGTLSGQICEDLIAVGESCSESAGESGEDFYWGIGAGVNFGEHFNVRLEYEAFQIDADEVEADADFISGSVVYRF
jgi:OOP family OmpA-OmpF porin